MTLFVERGPLSRPVPDVPQATEPGLVEYGDVAAAWVWSWELANETGGRAYFVTDARELPKIYQTIWDELSSQYAVAYSSANPKRDGAWRRIQVRLLRPNAAARTKQGYYGPTGS